MKKTIACRVRLLVPGDISRDVMLEWDPNKTYDEQLGRFLGQGAYAEHVTVSIEPGERPTERNRRDMFVDENGIARGLPRNAAAETFYPGEIYGPAVIFLDQRVWK